MASRKKKYEEKSLIWRFIDDVLGDFTDLGKELQVCCSANRGLTNGKDDAAERAPKDPKIREAKTISVSSSTQEKGEKMKRSQSAGSHDLDESFMQALESKALERARKSKDRGGTLASLDIKVSHPDDVDEENNPSPIGSAKSPSSDSSTSTNAKSHNGISPSAVQLRREEYMNSLRKSSEEEKMLNEISNAEKEGSPGNIAKAYEDAALFYCNVQGRPWKSVDFFFEAWKLLKTIGNVEREASFLGEATCAMVKARRLDEAIEMAERRAELLKRFDPAAANEAQLWVLDLRRRRSKTGHMKQILTSMQVERDLGPSELEHAVMGW